VWFDDLASVPTSYPEFFETLESLGAELVLDDARSSA
jgi:5-enolpyruvylshikimate-3-phosphate synthase